MNFQCIVQRPIIECTFVLSPQDGNVVISVQHYTPKKKKKVRLTHFLIKHFPSLERQDLIQLQNVQPCELKLHWCRSAAFCVKERNWQLTKDSVFI